MNSKQSDTDLMLMFKPDHEPYSLNRDAHRELVPAPSVWWCPVTASPSRERLLDDLRAFAEELGQTPTRTEMNESGPHSSTPYYTEFGSWNAALEAAGLETNHRNDVPDEELLEALRELDVELDRTPRFEDMAERGEFAPTTYVRRWGSWPEAKEAAGLDPETRTSRRIEREELIEALQELAGELGKPPTQIEMNDLGRYSHRPYYRAFGAWSDALRAAGFYPNHVNHLDENRLVEAMQELAEELGYPPTIAQMNERGEFSAEPYFTAFGSWTAAWEAAGLEHRSWLPARASEEELLEAIRDLAEELGHAPTRGEMREQGPYSREPFERVFGSWSAALEEAGFSPYRQVDTDGEWQYYGPDWPEQRRTALERDGWACRDCGMTDEEHRAVDSGGLHVHHRTPFREFEDREAANRLGNLVTLCRACHSDRERE